MSDSPVRFHQSITFLPTRERDAGILKRTAGTPLPAVSYFGAKVLHALFVALLLVALTAAFGRVFYQADVPTGMTLVRFLVMVVVGSTSFCARARASASIGNASRRFIKAAGAGPFGDLCACCCEASLNQT